jgi:hypothetical protein
LDEKDGGSKWRLRGADEALGNHTINVVLEEFELSLRHIVYGTKNGFGVGDEGDLMINPRAVRREFLGVLGFEDICEFRILFRDGSRRVGG